MPEKYSSFAINTSVLIFPIFYFGPFCVKSLIKDFFEIVIIKPEERK